MENKQAQLQQQEVKDIELVDIEDIVPLGGNSLFLCLARVLIYMSHKNVKFQNALNLILGVNKNDLKSDIHLQNLLRIKLCEYWLNTGIYFDTCKNTFCLSAEFTNYFNHNVYDFLIQVYQMSINNFSNNSLYKKYALLSLSKMLRMKIFYKRSNGQWKLYGNSSTMRQSLDKLKYLNQIENDTILISSIEYLNNTTIYLQEFKSDFKDYGGQTLIYSNKNVRFLLDKRLWLSNYHDNSKICMKYSQFNDKDELKLYQDVYFMLDYKKIIYLYLQNRSSLSLFDKYFCVFVYKAPIEVLTRFYQIEQEPQNEFDFSPEYNTIGKQIKRFESKNNNDSKKLVKYFNFLWNDFDKFNQDNLNKYFLNLIN